MSLHEAFALIALAKQFPGVVKPGALAAARMTADYAKQTAA